MKFVSLTLSVQYTMKVEHGNISSCLENYKFKFWGVFDNGIGQKSCVVQHKKDDTNPIAWEPRVGGERQTDGYRTCSDLSQCYKAQVDHFTQYKWTHLQT
jgi:hypothetical protein